MNKLEHTNESNDGLRNAEGLTEAHSAVQSTTDSIRTLIELNGLQDPGDIRIVSEACAFLDAPTNDLAAIKKHGEYVAIVLSGFDMNGEEPPAAVDALHLQLLTLLCRHYIASLREALLQSPPNTEGMKHLLQLAVDAVSPPQYDFGTLKAELEKLRQQVALIQ